MSTTPRHDPATCFQRLILNLQGYWAEQGCVILQPYDMEVGAGTFHPATTLRSLGPDRVWNTAYVQPSRRPKDGRSAHSTCRNRRASRAHACAPRMSRSATPTIAGCTSRRARICSRCG